MLKVDLEYSRLVLCIFATYATSESTYYYYFCWYKVSNVY